MEGDFKTIIYIIFVIIWILSRVLRKKKPKAQTPAGAPPPTKPSRDVTFEDLLREFGADIPKQEKAPKPEPQPVLVSEREKEPPYRHSIESVEQFDPYLNVDEKEKLKFERSEHYKIQQQENNFAQKLSNPENIVDAIIFNEILKRKYH